MIQKGLLNVHAKRPPPLDLYKHFTLRINLTAGFKAGGEFCWPGQLFWIGVTRHFAARRLASRVIQDLPIGVC
jgi:hypothetical protein